MILESKTLSGGWGIRYDVVVRGVKEWLFVMKSTGCSKPVSAGQGMSLLVGKTFMWRSTVFRLVSLR